MTPLISGSAECGVSSNHCEKGCVLQDEMILLHHYWWKESCWLPHPAHPSPTFQLNSQRRGTKEGNVNDINPLSENRCRVQSIKKIAARRPKITPLAENEEPKKLQSDPKYPRIISDLLISFHECLIYDVSVSPCLCLRHSKHHPHFWITPVAVSASSWGATRIDNRKSRWL